MNYLMANGCSVKVVEFQDLTIESAKSEVVREKWGGKWGGKIMARRLRIAQLMIDNPGISTKELARALKLSTSGVENHLKAMRTAGCIRHVGPTKGGHWEVIE